jgi:hypothetical protein
MLANTSFKIEVLMNLENEEFLTIVTTFL